MTVLVIVEVLSVQDMVALATPPYAAAGSAAASARSKAIPRATRSRRFIATPPSVLSANNQGFPYSALKSITLPLYRTASSKAIPPICHGFARSRAAADEHGTRRGLVFFPRGSAKWTHRERMSVLLQA